MLQLHIQLKQSGQDKHKMANISMYKTFTDYPNETGINQIAYPLRDAILIINPFFVMLMGFFLVLTVGSYYTFANFVGRTRLFISLTGASFVVTIISFFFAMGGLITPIHSLTFVGITAISFIGLIFYR